MLKDSFWSKLNSFLFGKNEKGLQESTHTEEEMTRQADTPNYNKYSNDNTNEIHSHAQEEKSFKQSYQYQQKNKSPSDTKGYYRLFGITANASQSEIKIAYRKKAHELHPDKNIDKDATQKFQELSEAYNVLSDPEKKKAYDSNEYGIRIVIRESEPKPDVDIYKYNTNVDSLRCDCLDWLLSRAKFKNNDPRRLCKHLIAKFDLRGEKLNLPKALEPFNYNILKCREGKRGFKHYKEIVFLEDSIVLIDDGENFDIYLKNYFDKQHIEAYSYHIYKESKYTYRWFDRQNRKWSDNYEDVILGNEQIDGIDYLEARFKIYCVGQKLYKNILKQDYSRQMEARREEERFCQKQTAMREIISANFARTGELLIQFNSNITTLRFHKILVEMKYLIKVKTINNMEWILIGDGLAYGMNYLEYSTQNADIPEWYVITVPDYESMTLRIEVNRNSMYATSVLWKKHKFQELLNLVIANSPIEKKQTPKMKAEPKEKTVSKKKAERDEWLQFVECPHCASKNIHKKNKRKYGYGEVQRYQCMDCKKIFQEVLSNE